jgi:hypothetical protein
MLNYVPPAVGESISVVDTFERTSNEEVRLLRESLRHAYEKDRGRSQIRELLERYEAMSNLLNDLYFVPDDWNAYGSPAPSKPSIEISRGILNSLWTGKTLPDRVLPSADGGVSLVFLTDNDNRAVIETLNDDTSFLLLYDRRGNSKTLAWNDAAAEKDKTLQQLQVHLNGGPLAAV